MWPPHGEVQGHGAVAGGSWDGASRDVPPQWFHLRLAFDSGSHVDVVAVVSEGRASIEDMRAQPPLSLDEFGSLAEWIQGPLEDARRAVAEQRDGASSDHPDRPDLPGRPDHPLHLDQLDQLDLPGRPEPGGPAAHRARPSRPRGAEGRRTVAEAYRAAQDEGRDPVLAVMYVTGRSRRKSLRLIAAARDAGFLSPRHHRR
ncbi:hypothetical protein GTY65_03010 [Streptomyces sp. SID8379]|uniref:DUF6214 family protein n=1 Tax=Streptomyces sp. SID8379 TaxID=2690359 RepID=UPI000998E740|nr:DUF6214 family protein [Streptomyces sp. HmicA12]MYW63052.1 hypothetical protein [Streptomyces sp. SID8379]